MSKIQTSKKHGEAAAAQDANTGCGAPVKYGEAATSQAGGALIAAVDAGSVAEKAGLAAGMTIQTVDGQTLRDIIDWLWLSDGDEVELLVTGGTPGCTPADESPSLRPHTLTIKRDYGQPWGISFADPLFDTVMTCNNACLFCFMTMLPKGMRAPLYLRDDDYRLSFLQGNFVTLTNLSAADIERIIEQNISPLHVSLHAISPKVRQNLMGKNHARGIAALKTLLKAGIKFHAQIVLMPNVNDGSELDNTLQWIAGQEGILSVGIVPYGYTKYAKVRQGFSGKQAQALIAQIAPYQERSRDDTGQTRFQLADEWYLLAQQALPPAPHYDGYLQYEDGIGMLRSFKDDWQAELARLDLVTSQDPASKKTRNEVKQKKEVNPEISLYLVTGEAFAPTLKQLVEKLPVMVIPITNTFFGGNVNVTGLLTAQDIVAQIGDLQLPASAKVVLPNVIFNSDGLTLDNSNVCDIAQQLNREVIVVTCNAKEILSIL